MEGLDVVKKRLGLPLLNRFVMRKESSGSEHKIIRGQTSRSLEFRTSYAYLALDRSIE